MQYSKSCFTITSAVVILLLLFIIFLWPSYTVDASLDRSWTKTYGGDGSDKAYAVAVDSYNNIIVTGFTEINGNKACYTIKYDQDGNLLFSKTYNTQYDERAYGVAVDSNNNIIVTGSKNSDYFTIKYDANGNELWEKRCVSPGVDTAYDVAVDSMNNIIVTGETAGKYRTIKYAPDGTELWNKTYSNGYTDSARGVTVDSANNIIVTGYIYTADDVMWYTVKYNQNGVELWNQIYNEGYQAMASDVAVDSEDNIIVIGTVYETSADADICILKYNKYGTLLWEERYDGVDDDFGRGVAVDSNNNIIITGTTYTYNKNKNFYTAKYTSDGTFVWSESFDNGAGLKDYAYGVAVDNLDNVVVTGFTEENGGFPSSFDYLTIKYTLFNSPPSSTFSYEPHTIYPDDTVEFVSTSTDSDGTVVSQQWEFGDGETGSGSTVTHFYAKPGTYKVNLTVTDNDGATSTSSQTITVLDVVPPEITDTTTSNVAYTGDSFTFEATVTDNAEVDHVQLTYWYDDPATMVSMSFTGSNHYTYAITVQHTLQQLHYYITAYDTSNNWNTTQTKNIQVLDNDAPTIANVDAEPNPQQIEGVVNITATVTDNIEIQNIFLRIQYPDETFYEIEITSNKNGDTYYYTTSYNNLGDYIFYILATDTSGNQKTSENHVFSIIDDTPPTITDTTGNLAYTGDIFTFSATVEDELGVERVYVEYWYGGGDHTIKEMTHVGNGNYERSIIVDDTLQLLHYEIFAKDTSNNWEETGTKEITVVDNDLPEITDTTLNTAGTGNTFVFSAYVTDNVAVSEVTLEYWYGAGEHNIVSMQQTDDEFYQYTVTIENTLETLHYFIAAYDTSNNQKNTPISHVTITDDDPPTIETVQTTPSVQETGGTVNITSLITDNIEIETVVLSIQYPDGDVDTVQMMNVGSTYYYEATYTSLGEYQISITARDTSGNLRITQPYAFSIVDTTPPVITDLTSSQATVGESFQFIAQISDNVNVENAYVEYWYGNGQHLVYEMSNTVGNQYEHYIVIENTLENLHYEIFAKDESNNLADTGVKTVVLQDKNPASIENVTIDPPSQKEGYSVNISCRVVDNVEISSVTVTVTGPQGFSLNDQPMENTEGGRYFYFRVYTIPGVYSFTINVRDTGGNENVSSLYRFTIYANRPPLTPSNPLPADKQPNVGIDIDLSWNCSDPDDVDTITYTIYLSDNPNLQLLGVTTNLSYKLDKLKPDTTYYWKVVVSDGSEEVEGPIWYFTTISSDENDAPNPPEQPNGSVSTTVGVATLYSSKTIDPEGDSIKYEFDWGDDTRSQTTWLNSGSTVTLSHQWDEEGTYTIRVRAFDGIDWSDWSKGLTVSVSKPLTERNHPPNPPQSSSALSEGYVDETYTFTIFSIDPDEGDRVQCMVDWGDGNVTGWSQYVSSGDLMRYSHTWKSPGSFVVKAKARDEHGAASSWNRLFTIKITRIFDADNDGVPDAADPFPENPDNVKSLLIEGEKYYLVNSDSDKLFDHLYDPQADKLLNIKVQGDNILLDINDDGTWDYIYLSSEGKVEHYQPGESKGSFPYYWLYIALPLILLILGGGFYYVHQVSSISITKRFICPVCRNSVELKGKRGESIEMVCPYCQNRGIIRF